MPYIPSKDKRFVIDQAVNSLARSIAETSPDEKEFPGNLNYAITRLLIRSIIERFGKLRYYIWAWVRGVLGDVYTEFYRRKTALYEDKKMEENGDVGYDELPH